MMKLCTGKLTKRVSDFLKKIGITGPIELQTDGPGEYVFHVGSEHQFYGFYPVKDHSRFTLQLINTPKALQSGIDVEYVEAFVFLTKGFIPVQFVIQQYPQMQVIHLLDIGRHHKGDVEYINTCPYGTVSSRTTKLKDPVFTSEMVNLSKFLG